MFEDYFVRAIQIEQELDRMDREAAFFMVALAIGILYLIVTKVAFKKISISKYYGYSFRVLGWVLILIGLVTGLYGTVESKSLMVIGWGVFSIGLFINAAGKKVTIKTADEVLSKDKRSPVLFLRGFTKDDSMFEEDSSGLFRVEFSSLAEKVLKPFWKIGPVIGLKNPHSNEGSCGYSASYCDSLTWKSKVIDFIDISNIAVVILWDAQGLEWEVKTFIEKKGLSKLVLIFPPDTLDTQERLWMFFLKIVRDVKHDEDWVSGEIESLSILRAAIKEHWSASEKIHLVTFGDKNIPNFYHPDFSNFWISYEIKSLINNKIKKMGANAE